MSCLCLEIIKGDALAQDFDALTGDAEDGGEFFERRHDQVVWITFLALAFFVERFDGAAQQVCSRGFGQAAVGFVDLGEQCDIGGLEAARKGLGRNADSV